MTTVVVCRNVQIIARMEIRVNDTGLNKQKRSDVCLLRKPQSHSLFGSAILERSLTLFKVH